MVLKCRDILLFRTYALCSHEGKLQHDRLEFENFEVEMLARGGFLWLWNIDRMLDQNTTVGSVPPRQIGGWNNELNNLCIPGSALDLRQVIQRQQEVLVGFDGQRLQQDRTVLDEQYTVG